MSTDTLPRDLLSSASAEALTSPCPPVEPPPPNLPQDTFHRIVSRRRGISTQEAVDRLGVGKSTLTKRIVTGEVPGELVAWAPGSGSQRGCYRFDPVHVELIRPYMPKSGLKRVRRLVREYTEATKAEAARAAVMGQPTAAPVPQPEIQAETDPLLGLTPQQRRSAYGVLIENWLDEGNMVGAYRDGWSDSRVAAFAGSSVAAIAELRRRDFGEIKVPSEVDRVHEELREVRDRISALHERLNTFLAGI